MRFRNLGKTALNHYIFKVFLKVGSKCPCKQGKIKCSKQLMLLKMPFRIKNLTKGLWVEILEIYVSV